MKQMIYTLSLGFIILGCTTTANDINLDGTIYVKGSMPHTYIIIEDRKTQQKYQIINAKEFNLYNRQKQYLNIKAQIIKHSSSSLIPSKIKVLKINAQ
jgi:hypothetical protein